MPIPIVNSIASWFLKKRFHQIELFLKYPNEVQNELLLMLIDTAKDTEIGKAYDFASIKNYTQFAERVPVSAYEDLQSSFERSRKGENNISKQYLDSLNNNYNKLYNRSIEFNVHIIDANRNLELVYKDVKKIVIDYQDIIQQLYHLLKQTLVD